MGVDALLIFHDNVNDNNVNDNNVSVGSGRKTYLEMIINYFSFGHFNMIYEVTQNIDNSAYSGHKNTKNIQNNNALNYIIMNIEILLKAVNEETDLSNQADWNFFLDNEMILYMYDNLSFSEDIYNETIASLSLEEPHFNNYSSELWFYFGRTKNDQIRDLNYYSYLFKRWRDENPIVYIC